MAPTNPRFVLTPVQLKEYFHRIALPSSKQVSSISELSSDPKAQLEFLSLLFKHHLVKVPWENLTQHYSWHRVVNVQPEHLFAKIVQHAGAPSGSSSARGGYCMEVNHLFHTVLRSLGFDAYMAGARVYSPPEGTYGGWTHVVNLVRIDGRKYLLDVGFGAQGPCRPLELVDGNEDAQIAPARMRVAWESIPDFVDPEQKIWVYQFRTGMKPEDQEGWAPTYCFTETEFLPSDIRAMNYEPWISPRIFFTQKIVAARFTTDKEDVNGTGSPGEQNLDGDIDGTITVNHDALRWRRRGKGVVKLEFKSEQERLEAFEKYFGIYFEIQDQKAIAGTAACIANAPAESD